MTDEQFEKLLHYEFPCECWPDNSSNKRWTHEKYSVEIFGVEQQDSSYKADAMLTCSKCGQNWTSMIQFDMTADEVTVVPSDFEIPTFHLHVFDVDTIRFAEYTALSENDGGPVSSFHAECKICFDSVWSGDCEWS
mgnify:FL=1